MEKALLKKKVDQMVKELIEVLKLELGANLEGLNLVGSYATGQVSLERPNVNIIGFLKQHPPAEVYLRAGRLLYEVGSRYQQFFRFRVDLFPFRFAQPIGGKDPEVSVNLNLYDLADKNLEIWITPDKKVRAPFGAPEPVIQSFKFTRKVVFGKDILGGMEFSITREDTLLNILKEFPTFYKPQLIKAPLTYDIDQNYDLLATEALEIGKSCLASAVPLLLDGESVKQGKHLELLMDKGKMLAFFEKSDSAHFSEWAKIILGARENFSEVKRDKTKVLKLYQTSFNLLNTVLGMARDEIFLS
jgi:hypothetical protein